MGYLTSLVIYCQVDQGSGIVVNPGPIPHRPWNIPPERLSPETLAPERLAGEARVGVTLRKCPARDSLAPHNSGSFNM